MKVFFTRVLITLLLWCSTLSVAQAKTYYVSQGGSGSMDGTSYKDAYPGWSAVKLNVLVAGDTLMVCGRTLVTNTVNFDVNGAVGKPIVLSGKCSTVGGLDGSIDGSGVTTRAILALGTVGGASAVVVEDLTIHNSATGANNNCVHSGSFGIQAGYTFKRVTIRDCGFIGILLTKAGTTVQDSIVSHVGRSGIVFNASAVNNIVRGSKIDMFGLTGIGDGIACQTDMVGDLTIERNTIVWNNPRNEKQGIICGNSVGTQLIQFNTLLSLPPQIANNGITIARGSAIVRGNTVIGFKQCIAVNNDTTAPINKVLIHGNFVQDCYQGIRLAPSYGSPHISVVNNTGVRVQYGLSGQVGNAITAAVTHINNIWVASVAPMILDTNFIYSGDYNFYYPEQTSFIVNYSCGGGAYATLVAYQASCAQDQHSSMANPEIDRAMIPSPSSPAYKAGVRIAECIDISGVPCPSGKPNVGAYQSWQGDRVGSRYRAGRRRTM